MSYLRNMQCADVHLTGNAICIAKIGYDEKVISVGIQCDCHEYYEYQSNEYGSWTVGEYDWEEKDIKLGNEYQTDYYTVFNVDGTTTQINEPIKEIVKYLKIDFDNAEY